MSSMTSEGFFVGVFSWVLVGWLVLVSFWVCFALFLCLQQVNCLLKKVKKAISLLTSYYNLQVRNSLCLYLLIKLN